MILIFFSAVLRVLSFPKFDFIPGIYFVSLIPFFFLAGKKKKDNFRKGFFAGLLANYGIYYWLIVTIRAAGENPIVSFLIVTLLVLYLSLYDGIFVLLSGLFPAKKFLLNSLLIASAWTFLEYLRGLLFTGFPWMLFGYSAYRNRFLIQTADLPGGVYAVSFLLVLVNALIFNLVRQKKKKEVLVSILALVTGLYLYGYVRLKEYSGKPGIVSGDEKGVRIALLQGSIDQFKKWDEEFKDEIFNIYGRLYREAVNQGVDLVILPETAIPGFINSKDIWEKTKEVFSSDLMFGNYNVHPHLTSPVKGEGFKHLSPRGRGQGEGGAPYLLLGTPYFDLQDRHYYNSAIFYDGNMSQLDQYDKMHLVPFGEYVPLRKYLSRYIKVVNALGDFGSGSGHKMFTVKGVGFSPNICFEAIFPALVKNSAKKADVIVNLTNDAWYLKTSGPHQHFIMNIFRAVENRKPVIRCANTGISAFIGADGKIIDKTALFERRILIGTVPVKN